MAFVTTKRLLLLSARSVLNFYNKQRITPSSCALPSVSQVYNSTSGPILNGIKSNQLRSFHGEQQILENTPFGINSKARKLLDGLDTHIVPSKGDKHPLTVYSYKEVSEESTSTANGENGCANKRRPILLLHGRTWSSVPVYHLENRSIMKNFHECNLEPYAMDFRGFGGTPKDNSGIVSS